MSECSPATDALGVDGPASAVESDMMSGEGRSNVFEASCCKSIKAERRTSREGGRKTGQSSVWETVNAP